ncbi:MAG TPA: type II secretion system protein GspM [Ideonella sp.]|uniref:type II secretion system protein GspM n=1 Tax=Ideonella sp. TaxID=1929293 RepID=UPI002E357CED|nr:type II secretion system protein GspM [Ideonella sp.]HEX5687060.1 type II secretion system protein GspM [Ideonella sp.]
MNAQQELRQRWARMTARERALVGAGIGAIALLLLWYVGLYSAWTTWKTVPAQKRALELDWMQMQRLANEARDLKTQPPVNAAQAAEALKSATDRLGANGKLSQIGDRATLNVTGVSPEALRTWLAEVRSGARARPVDMQVNRAEGGLSGQVVVTLAATS